MTEGFSPQATGPTSTSSTWTTSSPAAQRCTWTYPLADDGSSSAPRATYTPSSPVQKTTEMANPPERCPAGSSVAPNHSPARTDNNQFANPLFDTPLDPTWPEQDG